MRMMKTKSIARVLYVFFICVCLNNNAAKAQDSIKAAPVAKKLKTIVLDAGHGGYDPGAEGEESTEAQLTLEMTLKLGKKIEKEMPGVKVIYTRTTSALPGNLNNKDAANRLRAQIANDAHADLFIAIHCNSTNIKYETVLEGYRDQEYTVWVGKGRKKHKETRTRQVPIYRRFKSDKQAEGTQTYIWANNKNSSKKEFVGKGDYGEEEDSAFADVTTQEQLILAALRTQKFFKNSFRVSSLIEEEFANVGRNSWGVKQRNWSGIWVLQATNMPSILIETGFISSPKEEQYLISEKGQHELMDAVVVALKKYKEGIENPNKMTTQTAPATNNNSTVSSNQ